MLSTRPADDTDLELPQFGWGVCHFFDPRLTMIHSGPSARGNVSGVVHTCEPDEVRPMEREYLHELYPNIPIGIPLELLLHAERSQRIPGVGGFFAEHKWVRLVTDTDKMKGSPGELALLELDIANTAFSADKSASIEHIVQQLAPTPGWTLSEQTRHRLQQWEHFDLRTLVSTQPGTYGDRSYYNSGDAYNPELPGEVADYLGVGPGDERELRIVNSDDTATLSRTNDGTVQLHGLGEYLAKHGNYRGEMMLRFTRNNTLDWAKRSYDRDDTLQVPR